MPLIRAARYLGAGGSGIVQPEPPYAQVADAAQPVDEFDRHSQCDPIDDRTLWVALKGRVDVHACPSHYERAGDHRLVLIRRWATYPDPGTRLQRAAVFAQVDRPRVRARLIRAKQRRWYTTRRKRR